MRILLIHVDYINFEVKDKAVKAPEEIKEKVGRAENALVAFMAVEKSDEKNPESVAEKTVSDILDVKNKVKADTVVVYPYAHLSSSLSSLDVGKKVIDAIYNKLKEKCPVIKAPFGWYKSFELKCKGHPLSELSRTILPEGVLEEKVELKQSKEEVISESLKEEEKIKSNWFIMTTDGVLHDVGKFDYKEHERLKKFAFYEKNKSRAVDRIPAHIELMKKLELVDYEPASDPGNLRYYPKGRMIKALLEQYVTDKILEYGGIEVETPIMYDFEHPSLAKYLNRFPARQYTLESDQKKYFLRFAACFGQFLIAHDATLSYKNLPLRLYEMTRYSFRREKSGELAGLRRLRAFTMPDVHAICENLEQAMDEYKRRFRLCVDTIEGIGLKKDDIELAVRVTKDFYDEYKEFVQYIVKSFGKPALVEIWEKQIFYFILKYEFNFVDALDKASCLSTDQIDIENGERYDIKFVDRGGKKKHPIILHCSPSGAIERIIYALLEKAYMDKISGKIPQLPLWLCPTQIRIIPVSENFVKASEEVSKIFEKENIRVDIDDRSESINKKIREAEQEWIPYIVVIGENEKKTGKLSVRIRESSRQESIKAEELIKEVKEKTGGMPYRPLPLPKLISNRPSFVG